MARLCNFDYKSPYFYMVTLKKQPGIAEFSKVGDDGRLVKSDITRAFESVIEGFHLKWRCIEPVSPYAIMPDHIHLMMKIKPTPDRVALGVIVSQLSKALRCEYWRIVAADAATRSTRPPLPAGKTVPSLASTRKRQTTGTSSFSGSSRSVERRAVKVQDSPMRISPSMAT